MPSPPASSARGGRSSAAITDPPARSAVRRSMVSVARRVLYLSMTPAELRAALAPIPSVPLVAAPTLVEPMHRLSAAIGGGPQLVVKRDDAIAFGFGGNKVRKLALVAA